MHYINYHTIISNNTNQLNTICLKQLTLKVADNRSFTILQIKQCENETMKKWSLVVQFIIMALLPSNTKLPAHNSSAININRINTKCQ